MALSKQQTRGLWLVGAISVVFFGGFFALLFANFLSYLDRGDLRSAYLELYMIPLSLIAIVWITAQVFVVERLAIRRVRVLAERFSGAVVFVTLLRPLPPRNILYQMYAWRVGAMNRRVVVVADASGFALWYGLPARARKRYRWQSVERIWCGVSTSGGGDTYGQQRSYWVGIESSVWKAPFVAPVRGTSRVFGPGATEEQVDELVARLTALREAARV